MPSQEEVLSQLRYIPKYELANLVVRKFSGRKEQLKELIRRFDGVKTKDPYKKVRSYNNEKLFRLYELIDPLPIRDIQDLFKEYAYTNFPTLFFCYIHSIANENFYQKSQEQIKQIILTLIQNVNQRISSESKPNLKNLKLVDLEKISGVIEIDMEYESRIDYIHPQYRSVKYVYNLENGNVWISIQNKAIIINVTNSRIIDTLIEILEGALGANIGKYNIPKEVGDELFGFDTIKKADFIEQEPENMDFDERKSVSDPRFSEKRESRLLNERCDRKSALHRIEMIDRKTSIVANDAGRVNIYAHVKKSDLRVWAFEQISKISELISRLDPEDFGILAKCKDASFCNTLKQISSSVGKELFKEIFVGVKKIILDGSASLQLRNGIKSIYINLKNLFIPIFQPSCESCSGVHYKHSCGAVDSIFVDGFLRLKCAECGRTIEVIENEIKCLNDESHTINTNIFDNIILMSTSHFNKLANDFANEIGLDLQLDSKDIVRIQNRMLFHKKLTDKMIYLFDEVMNFASLTPLDGIPQGFKSEQLRNIGRSTEKCANQTESNCRNCMLEQHGLCVQRLTGQFVQSPQLHSHHGHEYGDMKFNVTWDNTNTAFVGVAKACRGNPDIKFTLKNPEGLKLLAQSMELFMDTRVRGVSVISSAFLDERLTETLEAFAKYYVKKFFFIRRDEIIRMLYDYMDGVESITSTNYWPPEE